MKWVRPVVAVFLVLALCFVLGKKHGMLPPLGPFFSPFTGFWQNNEKLDPLPETLRLTGLEGTVKIVVDERRVPHVFAENEHDLFFAQGYMTARDRLWQMEMQIRYAGGRLAEVMGPGQIGSDIFQRRIGMVAAAEAGLKCAMEDEEIRIMVEAYTQGVNTYISSLTPGTLPLEYKLMDFRPEPWTPLSCAMLLKYMAWDLSGYNQDLAASRTLEALGEKAFRALFPAVPPFPEPVIPFSVYRTGESGSFANFPQDGTAKGSNNWAVSGSRSVTGYPILCSDPHLGLSLPSIWYEIQLSCPGIDCYGVSLPGAPSVIIGFNRDIAWGETNAGSDVIDWYRIEFADPKKETYSYAGGIRNVEKRIETIPVRGGQAYVDTVLWTHHGPVVQMEGDPEFAYWVVPGASMRWTGHDPSNEFRTFLSLDKARNYQEFRNALKTFASPTLNFAFASRDGDIAMHHTGRFPIRNSGAEKIRDGSDPADEWKKFIDPAQVPHVKNPVRGFVSSANQEPVAGGYPYPMPGYYGGFARPKRINETLAANRRVTPEDMMDLQIDGVHVYGRTVLPALLKSLRTENLTPEGKRTLEALQSWNFENSPDAVGPVIYDGWWRELRPLIWSDDLPDGGRGSVWPSTAMSIDVILNHREFLDDRATPEKETLSDLATKAFQTMQDSLTRKLGPLGENWELGKVRGTDIFHLAGIPALSRMDLVTGGGADIVNATSRIFGPSWRMVVALGPDVKAWGVYPGGQSGNPGSPFYDSMVDDWIQGKYHPLHFMKTPADSSTGSNSFVLKGVK